MNEPHEPQQNPQDDSSQPSPPPEGASQGAPQTPPPGAAGPDAPAPGQVSSSTSDYWLGHLLGLLTNIVGTLIWYAIKKDEPDPKTRANAVEALNWQLSFLIYCTGAGIVSIVTWGIGALLYFPLVIWNVVVCILAILAAGKGELYRYPLCLRLIK